jgi:hypothetical protein
VNPRPVMIDPDEAAKLLANHATPGTDPARQQAAIEAIRSMCAAAAAAGEWVNPAEITGTLDSAQVQLISATGGTGTRLVTWSLDDALALVQAHGTECSWEPHPYFAMTHCLLVVNRVPARNRDVIVWFATPAAQPT